MKSKYITSLFQRYFLNKDIREFKKNFLYYIIFRVLRNFLANDIIVQIYNFKIFTSINKKKTSHDLLKRCDFPDIHELNVIKKISNANNILLLDCGCNYGFYSFYTASLSKKNIVISVEASKGTSLEFLKNLELNDFENINFYNNAVSNNNNETVKFNESENDWESSQAHKDFKVKSTNQIKTITIDQLLKDYKLSKYSVVIKLDIEGNEISAIKGGLDAIKNLSPIIIFEMSKYIFQHKSNRDYLNFFLSKFDYVIFDVNNRKVYLDDLLCKLDRLNSNYKTIGNYYLIKNSSDNLKLFI